MNNTFSSEGNRLNRPTKNIMELIEEAQELSNHIAALKRKANLMEPGSDRDQLRQDIKMNG